MSAVPAVVARFGHLVLNASQLAGVAVAMGESVVLVMLVTVRVEHCGMDFMSVTVASMLAAEQLWNSATVAVQSVRVVVLSGGAAEVDDPDESEVLLTQLSTAVVQDDCSEASVAVSPMVASPAIITPMNWHASALVMVENFAVP